jgi:hypothetical protein
METQSKFSAKAMGCKALEKNKGLNSDAAKVEVASSSAQKNSLQNRVDS